MQRFRKVLFWAHLIAGVSAGIVILVMCVSGVLLSFEEAIVNRADRLALKEASAGGADVSMDALVLNAMEARDGTVPTGIALHSDPGAPIAFTFGRNETVFVSRSGENLGAGASGLRTAFRTIREWHRWLGRAESTRAIGKGITGAANLVFVFLLITGIYLWFPRKWNWSSVKAVLLLNRGARGRARDWNWHNVFGFWSMLPLLVIVVSGVIISYGWANNLLYRIAGSEAPAPRGGKARAGLKPGRGAPVLLEPVDLAFSKVKVEFPKWRMIRARISPDARTGTFAIEEASSLPQLRNQMVVNLHTGETERVERHSSMSTGRRWRAWARFLHTGEAGGIVGQVIAAGATFGGAVLAWTGLALAWRRFMGRRRSITLP
jgi:uncharacterized iron-regulated membrane protein